MSNSSKSTKQPKSVEDQIQAFWQIQRQYNGRLEADAKVLSVSQANTILRSIKRDHKLPAGFRKKVEAFQTSLILGAQSTSRKSNKA